MGPLFKFLISIVFLGALSGCGVMWVTIGNQVGGSTSPPFGSVQVQQIYRSVGPGNTSVLACGGTDGSGCLEVGGNLTISEYGGTFASALPTNIGVGDVIVYDSSGNGTLGIGDSVAFISGRVSSTQYSVQNSSGALPTSYGPASVWRIYRAYTSIQKAMTGFHSENTSIIAINNTLGWFDVGFNDNNNLVTVGMPWNIAVYGDAIDTYPGALLNISGWTTSVTDTLRIYAPYLSTEVGMSQRHSGVWANNVATVAFNTEPGAYVTLNLSNVIFDGLQMSLTGNSSGNALFFIQNPIGNVVFSNNILNGTASTNAGAISIEQVTGPIVVVNNIVYGWGISYSNNLNANNSSFFYNNTVINSDGFGIDSWPGKGSIINNLVTGSVTADYNDSALADYVAVSNNISGDATSPNAALRSKVVTFVNAGLPDYRLSPSDASALNAGTSLAAAPAYPFSSDISALSRPQGSGWDVGASEAVPATSNATEMLILSFGTTATTFTATATFNGDNNSNNSATVYYCNNTAVPGCNPLTQGVSAAMARGGGSFTYLASGLISGDTYSVTVLDSDPDGASGAFLCGSVTP